MNKIFFLAAILSLSCSSCKSKKETTTTSATNNNSNSTTTSAPSEKPLTYRLVVSFISKGGGPDHQKLEAFLNFVKSHPKNPVYETFLWGREGESDMCFQLTEFKTDKEKSDFVNEIKKISGGSDMMLINENTEYKKKGK
ncbi:MAG: hypothetical protein IT237_14250 [Bacteroidia bacterium]|nr:hypothetical protein [Bacteroidia bacterium]